MSLFNIYSGLSLSELLTSYAKIYNDVFVQEKPMSVYKYFLTQTMVVEMNAPFDDAKGNL